MLADQLEIRAKVIVPRSAGPTLRRERLLAVLRRALLGRLTVVSAPAGYGKTTLLAEFAKSLEFPVAWYSLDSSDATVPMLLRYLVFSVRQVYPAFGGRLLSRIQVDEMFGQDPREAAQTLVAEFQEQVSGYLVIVFDDLHRTMEFTAAREFFEELLANQPDNTHLMMASRTWPSLRSLDRMVANRIATVVGMKDLALSVDEVKELLALCRGVEVHREEAEQVMSATEGWPAPVILLAKRASHIYASDWASVVASEGPELFGYLAAEVYSQLPQDIQEFVLSTAVLDVLTPEVCDELLGRSDSIQVLNDLTGLNLPIEHLHGPQPTYRYHALFQEFLRQRLRSSSREAWIDLHDRAARMFARRENWEECIRHRSQIEHWHEVAEVIEHAATEVFLSGQWQTIARWVDQLPRRFLTHRPSLALLRARLAYLLKDADMALRLTALVRSSSTPANVQQLAESLVLRGAALTLKGLYAEAVNSCQDAIKVIGDQLVHDPIKADAMKFLGISEGMSGDYVAAEEHLSRALDVYDSLGDSYNAALCHGQLSLALGHLGKLDVAIFHLERARHIWTNFRNEHQLVRVLNNLAVAYHWRGALNEAESALKEALELSRQIGDIPNEGYALASLGDLERDRSNYGRARDLYRQGLDIARSLGDAPLTISAQVGLASVYCQEGNLEESETLATQALVQASRLNNPQLMGLALTTLAEVYRDRGDLEESVSTSSRASELFLSVEAKREAAGTLYRIASALYALRRRSEAMVVLERVAELVGELGYDQFLVLEAARDATVAEYAATKGVGGSLFASIYSRIIRFSDPKRTGARSHGSLPIISVRSFGGCSILLNRVRISDLRWQTAKSKEMFLYILFQQRPVHKEEIIVALWPDLEPAKTNRFFHGTLHRLRKATYPSAIVQSGGWYEVNPHGQFWLDAHEFREKTSLLEADRKSVTDLAAVNDALKLYQGPFAPEFYTDWAQQARTRMEDIYVNSLGVLLQDALTRNDFRRITTIAGRVLDVNPYDGDAWTALIRGHIRRNQRGSAFRLYRRCQDLFTSELGTGPPAAVTALTSELLA